MRSCRRAPQMAASGFFAKAGRHENGIRSRLLRYLLEFQSRTCPPSGRSRRRLLAYFNRLEPDGALLHARICREHWSGVGDIRVNNLRRKPDKSGLQMSGEFRIFEVVLNKRRRAWKWHVRTSAGDIVMCGSEFSRPAAAYNAYKAFFLLLQSAPIQSTQLSGPASRARKAIGRPPHRGKPVARQRFGSPDTEFAPGYLRRWPGVSPNETR